MSRYGKLYRCMYGDAKFRELSAPQPCGQYLFPYLLTGPQVTSIPGLFSAGPAALAERLRWPLEGFLRAFEEIQAQGMVRADFDAPLIFLPNAIKYNRPASANVVKSWKHSWAELPECELKIAAWRHFYQHLEGYSSDFLEAFEKACPKPPGMPSANQEQEQEQEQEKTVTGPLASDGPSRALTTTCKRNEYPPDFEDAWQAYPPRAGGNPKKSAFKAWKARRKEGVTAEELRAAVDRYFAFCDATDKLHGETVMQAQRFFGPNEEWKQEWTPPQKSPQQYGKRAEGVMQLEEFIREKS